MKSFLVTLVAIGLLTVVANEAQAQYFGTYSYGGSRTTIAIGFGNVGGFYDPYFGYYGFGLARPFYGFYDPYFYHPVYPIGPIYGRPGCYRGAVFYYRW